jgi:uncharacterized protein YlxW (UPF0749 family)
MARENKCHLSHTKFHAQLNKHEEEFHQARAKYETMQAQLKALGENLEESRRKAREATARMQLKMKEVECLRTSLGVDEVSI